MEKKQISLKPIIGMTEAGDAGIDFSWLNRLNHGYSNRGYRLANEAYVGAILITKAGHRPEFQDHVRQLDVPCIIHFGCTGWGGTAMEPRNPRPVEMTSAIRDFIDSGFPAERCVLRIDPIIPTDQGIDRALSVLMAAKATIPDVKRIRVSIYDDYHHSREEMVRRGFEPVDTVTKWKNEQERRPSPTQVALVAKALASEAPNQIFECCAEPELAAHMPDHFVWTGCLSKQDLAIMGIEMPTGIGINGQNRFGCRCLMMKRELLSNKVRCPNNCAYCYWGRK